MNSRSVGFPRMEPKVLPWKLDVRRGISLGLIRIYIKWWNVVILTFVGKLGMSPIDGTNFHIFNFPFLHPFLGFLKAQLI